MLSGDDHSRRTEPHEAHLQRGPHGSAAATGQCLHQPGRTRWGKTTIHLIVMSHPHIYRTFEWFVCKYTSNFKVNGLIFLLPPSAWKKEVRLQYMYIYCYTTQKNNTYIVISHRRTIHLLLYHTDIYRTFEGLRHIYRTFEGFVCKYT